MNQTKICEHREVSEPTSIDLCGLVKCGHARGRGFIFQNKISHILLICSLAFVKHLLDEGNL